MILKVCSADKVTLVDAVYGTNLGASAAAGAERVIYSSEVSVHGDSAAGTGLLTLHTADTAVGAVLTYVSALIVVRALYHNAGGIVDEVDDAVRTFSHADTATDTLTGIDLSYLVLDGDSVLRTNLSAVAVTKTSEGAELVAAVRHISGAAALESAELISSLYSLTGAVAGNVSNLLNYVLSLNAENGCDALSGRVTAGHAEIGRGGSALGESLSVAVTARVAAGATVSAGESVTDSGERLIFLNTEEVIGNGKKYCANERDTKEDSNGYNNF